MTALHEFEPHAHHAYVFAYAVALHERGHARYGRHPAAAYRWIFRGEKPRKMLRRARQEATMRPLREARLLLADRADRAGFDGGDAFRPDAAVAELCGRYNRLLTGRPACPRCFYPIGRYGCQVCLNSADAAVQEQARAEVVPQ